MSFRHIFPGAFALALALTAPVFAADHAVDIQGMAFSVPVLEVAVGDTVTFTNLDGAPHTATATDGSFDTGRLTQGQSATITITEAGTFDYFCVVHPSMTASITAQ
ncbi:plastocyanin/azurin family copper-binding protein [Pelagibacterium halotolerans]|uniref:Copper-binding protein, plastocyanin/azurin family n=1 Tax=Pelagibacterium halotolerans (strain DSM 22347 / JCM 15775 / CGMCC 1.7692 / B2) TaxID=1082931 RepID=G4RFA8_PELHB|nr:plastocyanin/azurin family copper-binding protein [Pelagibacterium halotolerans]AEQ50976.1 copper-binding protein, plastocyanin/azurin family [Pelagibacterium halotolerans B2]SEA01588.1 Plastocyanin [Pelagibacterium halotolerans]